MFVLFCQNVHLPLSSPLKQTCIDLSATLHFVSLDMVSILVLVYLKQFTYVIKQSHKHKIAVYKRHTIPPETTQTHIASNKIMNKSHYKWQDGYDKPAVRVNALFYVN